MWAWICICTNTNRNGGGRGGEVVVVVRGPPKKETTIRIIITKRAVDPSTPTRSNIHEEHPTALLGEWLMIGKNISSRPSNDS